MVKSAELCFCVFWPYLPWMPNKAEKWLLPDTPRLQRLAIQWSKLPKPPNIEEPDADKESVWSYPRPPAIAKVDARVQVIFADRCIADTWDAMRALETASPPTVYIPRADVEARALEPSGHTSYCEWKGIATHYNVKVDQKQSPDAAWAYPRPLEEYAMLADYVAFYPARVDACFYGGELVRPQPGKFYGGWVISRLTGPFKGEAGSESW